MRRPLAFRSGHEPTRARPSPAHRIAPHQPLGSHAPSAFCRSGTWLHKLACGESDVVVKPSVAPKSLNAFKSFGPTSGAELHRWLRLLADELVRRMAADRLHWRRAPKTLRLQFRLASLPGPRLDASASRQTALPGSVRRPPTTEQLLSAALDLLARGMGDHGTTPLTRVALSVADFEPLPKRGATAFFGVASRLGSEPLGGNASNVMHDPSETTGQHEQADACACARGGVVDMRSVGSGGPQSPGGAQAARNCFGLSADEQSADELLGAEGSADELWVDNERCAADDAEAWVLAESSPGSSPREPVGGGSRVQSPLCDGSVVAADVARPDEVAGTWPCRSCTFLNGPLLLACEMCGATRAEAPAARAASKKRPMLSPQSRPPRPRGGASGSSGKKSRLERDNEVEARCVRMASNHERQNTSLQSFWKPLPQ